MLTRCPHCQTAFRVATEQLRSHQGRVRCGSCERVFNALETLVEQPAVVTVTLPAAPIGMPAHTDEPALDMGASIAPENAGVDDVAVAVPAEADAPVEVAASVPIAGNPAAPDDAPGEAPTSIDSEASAGVTAASPRLKFGDPPSEPVNDAVMMPASQDATLDVIAHPTPPGDPDNGPLPADTPAHVPDLTPGETPPPVLPAVEVAPVTALPPRREPWRPSHVDADAGLAIPNEATTARDDSGDPGDSTPDAPEALGRPWWRSLGLLVLIGAAITALLAQAALHWRIELATLWPPARPVLEAACEPLQCRVELPQQIAQLSIESSDLNPDPVDKRVLILRAGLRNRAPFAQTWPHLEFTLTDASDRILARRVLAPGDYLDAATSVAAGIPAGADVHIERRLTSKDADAAGYRLYVFYP